MMTSRRTFLVNSLVIATFGRAQTPSQHIPASSIPADALISPADFAAALKSGTEQKTTVLQVGSSVMFAQAHITGSEYAGPGGKADGLKILQERVANLPKNAAIVLYCGCCPWVRCPNIAPAYNLLQEHGFANLKVIEIADNFGNDWVAKGYPTEKGRS